MADHVKKLTKGEVLHIAKLANIQVTDNKIEKYAKQLTDSLKYVENLNEIDTSKVSTDILTKDLKNVTKEDEADPSCALMQEVVIAPSHNKKDGYFVVKRIL